MSEAPESAPPRAAFEREVVDAIYDGLPPALLAVEDDCVLTCNAAFRSMWAVEERSLEGGFRAGLLSLMAERIEDAAAFVEASIALQDDRITEWSTVLRLRDGRAIDATTRPLRSPRGDDVGRLWSFDRRGSAGARTQADDHLATVGRIAASVAHEINNPLAYVCANLEYLAEAGEPSALPDWRQILRETTEGVERIRVIVADLKAISRGATQPTTEVTNLHRVLGECIRMATPHLKHRAQISWSFGAIPNVVGNPARLSQIFLNVLMNAAEALDDRRRGENAVHLHTTNEAGFVVTTIEDTGSGMSAETLARIFEPFFTSKAGTGTGLGLPIVKQTVESLGGRIEAKSELGRGTSFRVFLPMGEQTRAEPVAAPVIPVAVQSRATVLLIDDERGVRNTVARALGKHHDVIAFEDGRDALRWLDERHSVDLVLCDLMMPTMSGMEVYAELARCRPSLLPAVMFLTGGAFTEEARLFLARTGVAQVSKPFSVAALRQLVEGRVTARRPSVPLAAALRLETGQPL